MPGIRIFQQLYQGDLGADVEAKLTQKYEDKPRYHITKRVIIMTQSC